MFYMAKLTREIFVEPSVPSMMLTSEVYSEWVTAQKSLDECTLNFKCAETAHASEAIPVSKVDLSTKQAFFDLAQVFQTPGKKKTVLEDTALLLRPQSCRNTFGA